jgi:GT2 family glycosyltransferase
VGAYFLIRKKAMDHIGFLDDRYFLYFEEIDYCLTVRRAGWDVVFYPHAAVVHLGGQSAAKSGSQISAKGRQMVGIRLTSEFRYYQKFYGFQYVLIVAWIEIAWNLVVWGRNCLRRGAVAVERRKIAGQMVRLIFETLINDNWGKGPVQGKVENFA